MVKLFWSVSQIEEVHAFHGSSCKLNCYDKLICFKYSPEGTIAVVLSSGAFVEYA